MTTTPTSGPTPDDPRDVSVGPASDSDRALLADLHDFLVRLTRSRRTGRDLMLRALAAPPKRSADTSSRRLALLRAAADEGLGALARTGRPRHVDPPELRAALARDLAADAPTASTLLAWEAGATLDAADAAVLDLHLRHGLSTSELGEVLRLDPATAQVRLDEALARGADAMRALHVLRTFARGCDVLPRTVIDLPPSPTGAQLRAAVGVHVAQCASCRTIHDALEDPFEAWRRLARLPLPDDVAEAATSVVHAPATPTRSRWRGLRRPTVLAVIAATIGLASVAALASGGDDTHDEPPSGGQAHTDPSAPTVQIVEPAEDGVLVASQRDDLGWYVEVDLGAEPDDANGWSWRWMSDHQAGTLLNQAHGSTRLYARECGRVDHDITASVVDAEGHQARDDVHVVVEHPC